TAHGLMPFSFLFLSLPLLPSIFIPFSSLFLSSLLNLILTFLSSLQVRTGGQAPAGARGRPGLGSGGLERGRPGSAGGEHARGGGAGG
ncbi:unnamed protein product, partial [Urochloa humidicola]